MAIATFTTPAAVSNDDQLLDEVLDEVLDAFGVGRPRRIEAVAEGLMNRNWRVAAADAVFALKQILDVDAEQARRQHAATSALAALGLPVPAPVSARSWGTLLEHEGGRYALLPWASGCHRRGLELDHAECAHLGRLLADMHAGLAQMMPPAPDTAPARVADESKAKATIDRYLGVLDQRASLDDFDVLARVRLRERRELLEANAHLRPQEAGSGPDGWVHGDFHDLNVLWTGARVSAVLDWDRLRVAPLAAEVVRAATLLFGYYGDTQGLDVDRVSAFVAGYRDRNDLGDAALADAAHRLWWDRLCDFWQLKWHYDRNDHSCDHLFASSSALLSWWSAHLDQVRSAVASR